MSPQNKIRIRIRIKICITLKYAELSNRHAITNITGRDLGKSLELVVFLRLKQMHDEVFYWQEPGKGEVDFVGVKGNTIVPYQVTWNNPEPRHEKALQLFYENFPQANEAVSITSDNADKFL